MNIVFDLGGVLVKWEPESIIASAFDDPLVQENVRTQFVGHPDWLELDRGTLSRQDAIVRAAKRTSMSDAEVAGFLKRVAPALVAIPGTVDLLYRLKARGHTLFCLSNMHLDFIDHLEKSYTFWKVFSGAVISCRLQLCKPEPAIYSYLMETYGLDGSDTVFIDDTDVNLVTAAQFRIQTVKFQSPAQCENDLKALGCI